MLTTTFTKSTHSSAMAACVEVRLVNGGVEVRNSKLGKNSPVLRYTREEWEAFIAGVKTGEFDFDSLDSELT